MSPHIAASMSVPSISLPMAFIMDVPPSQGNTSSSTKPQDVPEGCHHYIILFIVILAVPSVAGTVSNILNICTFISTRLRDSVSISLLALSVSDLGISGFAVVITACLACVFGEIQHADILGVDARSLIVMLGYAVEVFRIGSTLITCYVAVTRSMCVIRPHSFRHTFTPARTYMVMCLISVASLCYTPIFAYTFNSKRFRGRTRITSPEFC